MSAAIANPLLSRARAFETPDAKRQLRVLTLTPFYPSAQDPTQGCFIAEPTSRLSQFGIQNHVIAANPFYRAAQQLCREDVLNEWRNFPTLPGNLGLATSGDLLGRALRRRVRELHSSFPIDLIHAHGALPCGAAAMFLGRTLDVPFVVSVHGLDVFAEKQAGRFLGSWTRRASMRVYREAKGVICISERVRQQLPDDLHKKTRVIYNGVDSGIFAPTCESSARLRILSVGNLIAIKGHAVLLRAFADVLKTIPNVELEIIGDGPERNNLVRLADTLGISAHVIFRERQNRQAVAVAMQGCAVFALPSRYEGLGCVYLEAMACGKPAIGCLGQGIDEIIEDGSNGVLVTPENAVVLAEALKTLLQDPELRRRIGKAAQNTILQRHTLEHQAQQLAELYLECVR
jgi:glycosyltransferase involved in cell wall biosynthesis